MRETFVTEGLDAVLTPKRRERPPTPAIFGGEAQAKLIALACSEPHPGHARWRISLPAEHVVERRIVEKAHYNTAPSCIAVTNTRAKGHKR